MCAGVVNPTAARILKEDQERRQAATRKRQELIEPNRDSAVKIEQYPFSLAKKIALGIPCTFTMRDSPDVNFRPQKLSANAPCPGMFYLEDLRIANVGCYIGGRRIDVYSLKDMPIDFPTMTPANCMTARVVYTGLVPPGYPAQGAPPPTAADLIALLEEMSGSQDLSWIHSRIGATLKNNALFEFTLGASGPASITA